MSLKLTAFRSALRLRLRSASTLSVAGGNASPRAFKEMPTEKGSSLLFGIAPEMIKEDLNQVQFYRRLIEKHGKLFRMKVAPGRYVVVVSDVDYIQFVRQNEGEHPVRGDFFRPLKIIIEAESELKYPPTALATGYVHVFIPANLEHRDNFGTGS